MRRRNMNINEPDYKWAYALTPRSVTTHLIIHHSAGHGTSEGIHDYHKSLGWAGIAYHYYVRQDGSIDRGRPENMRGGHTTNWNYCSIGVCFEGNFETEDMPQAQLEAGRELIADIRRRYPAITVGKHRQYQQTACPGRNFPFEEMLREVQPEPAQSAEDTGEPSDWAKEACEDVKLIGLFKGDGDGSFRWREPITREEMAVLCDRLIKYMSDYTADLAEELVSELVHEE